MTLTKKIAGILVKYRRGVMWLYDDNVSTPKAGESLTHDQTKEALIQVVKETFEEVVGEGEPQYLTKKDIRYQIGWCDGREQLREEVYQRIKEMI